MRKPSAIRCFLNREYCFLRDGKMTEIAGKSKRFESYGVHLALCLPARMFHSPFAPEP